jgi:hypothetical protein
MSSQYYDDGDRLTEKQLANKIGRTPRALRDRREKGQSAPYVKEGKTVIYSWRRYLEHLEANEQKPVRSRRAGAR